MHPEAAHGAGQRLECHWVPIPSCHIVCKCMHAYDSCSAEILDACLWLKGKERRSKTISAADKNQPSIPADCWNLPFWPDANRFSHECWYFDLSVMLFFFFFKNYSNLFHCIIVRGIPDDGWQEPPSWGMHVCADVETFETNSFSPLLSISSLLVTSETQTLVPSWASNLATQMVCVLNKSDCSFPCKYVTSPPLNLESWKVCCFLVWDFDISLLSLSFRGTQSELCHLECVPPSNESFFLQVFVVCQVAG